MGNNWHVFEKRRRSLVGGERQASSKIEERERAKKKNRALPNWMEK